MATFIQFKKGGATEFVKDGFSWPGLCFGCLHAAYRGMVGQFFLWMLLGFCTLGVTWFIYPFLANGIYRKHLINNGWQQMN